MKINITFLLFALLLAGCSAAAPTDAPSNPLETAPTATTTQSIAASGGQSQSQTIDGMTITISNPQHKDGQFSLDICHDVPDSGDWMLARPSFDFGGQNVDHLEFALIELRRPFGEDQMEVITQTESHLESGPDIGVGSRCDRLMVAVPDSYQGSATLSIEYVAPQPSEGGVCEEAYLQKVNQALDEVHPDLEADCYIYADEGGGGSGIEIVARPAGWTQADADATLSYDFFLGLEGVYGPWIFDIEIN